MNTLKLRTLENALGWVIVVSAMIFVLVPIVWLVIQSLVPRGFVLNISLRIFEQMNLSNYVAVLDPSTSDFFSNIQNSLIIAAISTIVTVALGSLSGYSFAKLKFKGSSDLKTWILSMRFFPAISIVIPLYLLWGSLGLTDTIAGMVLVYIALNLPFSVWLMSSFFQDLPVEIEEAAMVDGCSRSQAFVHVIMPLVSGGVAVTALFTFIMCWNEFIFALALTANKAATVTRGLTGMIGMYGGLKWGQMSAAGVLLVLPISVAAFLLQKHIVRGLTFGAVKA
jgi:multiple sugar transport system permease protein